MSFVYKEAWSNTREKTYDTKLGYGFAFASGISIKPKKGKSFSDIKLTYRSYSNGIENIVVPQSTKSSSKLSIDRFNYLGLGYQYSRYIKTIKGYNMFFSAGLEFSYILNRKLKLNYTDSSLKIKEKGKNISNNYGISIPPTFTLAYGVELDKGLLSVGKTTRLSFSLTFDKSIVPIASPSNQYIAPMINYQLVF